MMLFVFKIQVCPNMYSKKKKGQKEYETDGGEAAVMPALGLASA